MLKMKWFTVIGACIVLIGCASPTVFLTTEQLSERNRQELIAALSENGFKVKGTSNIRIPEEFPDAVYANFKGVEEPVTFRLSQVSVKTYAGMKTADKIVVTKSGNEILPSGCEFMIIHY